MSLHVNEDGKLLDRIVGAAIPVAISLAIAGVVWWSDKNQADVQATAAIVRIEKRIDGVELEARAQRAASDIDRQKMAELNANLSNVQRTMERVDRRVETILDRLTGPPKPLP